ERLGTDRAGSACPGAPQVSAYVDTRWSVRFIRRRTSLPRIALADTSALDRAREQQAALAREREIRERLPEEDWNIDICDNGAMRATCPKCGSWDVSYVAQPSVLECFDCGHTSRAKS